MVHFVGHQLQGRHERATGKLQAVLNRRVCASQPATHERIDRRFFEARVLEKDEQVARQGFQPFDRVRVRDTR